MQAIVSAAQAMRAGDGELFLAGGAENMSRASFLLQGMRGGHKFGNGVLVDTMLLDGLTDPTHAYHMENVAERYGITREEQDAFALETHRRSAAARTSGYFAQEIVPFILPSRKGPVTVTDDESACRHQHRGRWQS